jgi:hypothetical protein
VFIALFAVVTVVLVVGIVVVVWFFIRRKRNERPLFDSEEEVEMVPTYPWDLYVPQSSSPGPPNMDLSMAPLVTTKKKTVKKRVVQHSKTADSALSGTPDDVGK